MNVLVSKLQFHGGATAEVSLLPLRRWPPRCCALLCQAPRQGIVHLGVSGGCRRGAACGASETESAQVAVDLGSGQRFGHQVRWVLGAKHLVKAALLGPHKVLHPQLRNRQVANFADAASAADADRGGTIGMDLGG